MTHVDLIPALNKMKENGSGFYSLLASAWMKADLSNSRKLFREFGDTLIPFASNPEEAKQIEHAFDNLP